MITNRIRAWIELMKVGGSALTMVREESTYMRGNVVKVLKKEGWFDFLTNPRSINEIADQFQYNDKNFLARVVKALEEDKTLIKKKTNKFYVKHPLNEDWLLPKFFPPAIHSVFTAYAKAIPRRMRGDPVVFTSGLNLFDWDDALIDKSYEQARRGAFTFTNAWNRKGKFLDVGCGNGWGTTAIWKYFHDRHAFSAKKPMEIYGLDIDSNLLKIAEAESKSRIQHRLKIDENEVQQFEPTFPKFFKGSAAALPFEDNTFDMVYASQVLHWVDAQTSIKEMLRVCKPGGIVFGSEFMFPIANKFFDLHIRTVENATGCFSRNDLRGWAKDAGAKKLEMTTPATFFKIVK